MRQLVLLLFFLISNLFQASSEQERVRHNVQNNDDWVFIAGYSNSRQLVAALSPKSNSPVGKIFVKNDPVELRFCNGYCIVHNLRAKTYTVDSLYFGPKGKCPGGCIADDRGIFMKGNGPIHFGEVKTDKQGKDITTFIMLVHYRLHPHPDGSAADTIREATRYEGCKWLFHPVLQKGGPKSLQECKKGLGLK
ncbi:hypothetical protein KB206_07755 [Microvirga sp. STS02]|uniref:hypothetical protein n=1 Tax=Hymenobacter negativus TaxID=2795026 RepID=UPI0018DE8F54|nr:MULTISPECIES: hypothetical protein [Bacteria]MBH8568771.1 hypothetical protein [Hymenobacter negativus]MBR7208505.1 hypothetical protein [Microvirga sp. STS02]